MKILEILDSSDEDLKIKIDNLPFENARTPELFNKYHRIYRALRVERIATHRDLKKTLKTAWEYYSGKADPEVYKLKPLGHSLKLKENIDKFVQADEDVLALQTKLDIVEEKIDTVTSIMDNIKQRQWLLRNAIDSLKFNNGDN